MRNGGGSSHSGSLGRVRVQKIIIPLSVPRFQSIAMSKSEIDDSDSGNRRLDGFPCGARAASIYNFTNFDGPGSGTSAGAGTNMNGIVSNGVAVDSASAMPDPLRTEFAIQTEYSLL